MRASIVGDSTDQLIKIDINTDVGQLNFKVSKNIYTNETNWMLLKKLMVNELFGTIKLNLGFMIPDSAISKVYKLIMSIRGVDEETIMSASKFDQILWFLKELSEIKPDPSIVMVYLELYPEVDKQYFLSNMFRIMAFFFRQIPELQNILRSGNLDTHVSYASKILLKMYRNESYYSVEFEKFMDKYLPVIVRYIMDASLNLTSKNDTDIDIFSFHEFVNSDNDHRINIKPEKVFADRTKISGKYTVEKVDKKENVIRDKLVTPFAIVDKNSSSLKTETVDKENIFSGKSKSVSDNNNEQPATATKRSKGDELSDYNESSDSINTLLKKDEKNKKLSTQEKNEKKIVPNIPIKNFEHSDSVNVDETSNSKRESNFNQEKSSAARQETVSKKTHVHDDL